MVSSPVQQDVSFANEGTGLGELKGLEYVCDHEGYRYYKNTETGKQCCLDSTGHWFLFDEGKGTFIPMNDDNKTTTQSKPKHEDKGGDPKLRNVERFGIKFDHNGRPIFPKNERGLFVLPKDEKRLPFFPVDDKGKPIFPYDYTKGELAFPVDDTDEPIFPRNAQNKPIVPNDKNGQPLFPKDASGNFIFPFNESNCPIPALTLEGLPVVPKDAYGNFVIPQDRDGKPLIHIASDGVTPISAAEWKQWKKYYKDQARTFYKQQQLHMAAQNVSRVERSSANYTIDNSMFHPLNLEQQSVFFAADMQMLQLTRRVRPEDVDLPAEDVQQQMDFSTDVDKNGAASLDEKQLKRKKFLEAQLKSIKKPLSPKIEVKKSSRKETKNGKDRKKSKAKETSHKDKKNRNRSRKRQRRSSTRSRSTSRDTMEMISKRKRHNGKHSRSRSSSQYSSTTFSSRSSQVSRSPFNSENKKEEERLRKRLLSRTLPTNEQTKPEGDEYGPKPPVVPKNCISDMELSDEEKRNEKVDSQQKLVVVEDSSSTSFGKHVQAIKPMTGQSFNVKEVIESGRIDLIKKCKEQERERYDQLKLRIAELLVEKSVHKLNLVKLREAEKRIEGRDVDQVSVSSDDGV